MMPSTDNDQVIEDIAAVIAEAFYTPEHEIEIQRWGKLRYWQLGERDQARWRLVARKVVRVLAKNGIDVEVPGVATEARPGPGPGSLFDGGIPV